MLGRWGFAWNILTNMMWIMNAAAIEGNNMKAWKFTFKFVWKCVTSFFWTYKIIAICIVWLLMYDAIMGSLLCEMFMFYFIPRYCPWWKISTLDESGDLRSIWSAKDTYASSCSDTASFTWCGWGTFSLAGRFSNVSIVAEFRREPILEELRREPMVASNSSTLIRSLSRLPTLVQVVEHL